MDRIPTTIERFEWTAFFSEIADKLLQYRDDRRALIAKLIAISRSCRGGHVEAKPT